MTDGSRNAGAPVGARDVERLFAGDFGAAYTDRNQTAHAQKPLFFKELFQRHGVKSVLECGCNLGNNLTATLESGTADVWGIDIQRSAIERAWATRPGGNFVVGSILDLPFRDARFDLAFTCGVLIHVPVAGIGDVMSEMMRVSKRFILCAEYHDDLDEVAVPWRGQESALWRRNYKKLWLEKFPGLTLVEEGFEGPETGFDRTTWQLFRKLA